MSVVDGPDWAPIVQQPQRFVSSQTLAGASGTFTLPVGSLLAHDGVLLFMPAEVPGSHDQPVALTVGGVADPSITYGSIVIAGHQWDWVPVVPLFETQVEVTWTALGSQTNPVNLNIYAAQIPPPQPKKVKRAIHKAGTTGTVLMLGLTSVARLKELVVTVETTPSVTGGQALAIEATNAFTGGLETLLTVDTDTVGTTQGPYFTVAMDCHDYVCAGVPATNALQLHFFVTVSACDATAIYEDVRNI